MTDSNDTILTPDSAREQEKKFPRFHPASADPQGSAVGSALAAHPFTLSHTPEFPELLSALQCSLAISTYQAGKVIIVSSDGERLLQLPRTFNTATSMAFTGNRLAIAMKSEVVILVHDPQMGSTYPKQPGVYDTVFMPRTTYFTGAVAMQAPYLRGPRVGAKKGCHVRRRHPSPHRSAGWIDAVSRYL